MGLGSEIRNPRSGKILFRIPDPVVKKAQDPGSGSATLRETTFLFSEEQKYVDFVCLGQRI
jgi:hypothetical protein